ncbi:hypothetical protein B0H12DRAFT_192675 [Mycena haematopus]|nr:hypothetical protein B0H12DRAFT_192675 [Mycena haematopus]
MVTVGLDEATIVYDHRVHRYFYLAGIVLLLYDNLLTLDLEVRYIWKGWRTRTSAWFLLIRYSTLLLRILALLTFDFGNFDPEVCKKLNTAKGLVTVIQELFVGCTLILRVLAMYSFNKRVLIVLVTAAILCLGFAAWCTLPDGHSPTLPPTGASGCIAAYSHSQRIRGAGAWEALLAGDVLLLGFTLYWAYTHNRDIPTGSLWHLLIRDGALYFVIISLANLANILMFYFGDAIMSNCLAGFTVSYIFSLSPPSSN